MEDWEIISLYFQRDEQAITETRRKYGSYCHKIARNILSLPEDAEECVSDTYYAAWGAMPPKKPNALGVFLGRITRNLAIDRFRRLRAQKRYQGMELLLSELDDCVPAQKDVESLINRTLLAEAISRWLESLSPEDRRLFLRRYWYGEAVKDLAREGKETPGATAQRLSRLRKALRAALEGEDVL